MKFLDDFQKTKILVIGDVMLDRYWWGNVGRISPEAPVPVVRLAETTLAAGGAANVAVNIAGLGAEPILFGIVGDDGEAELVKGVLSAAGVSADHLLRVAERPTTVKTRIIAHGQHVARIDQERDDKIGPAVESEMISRVKNLIQTVDAIIVSDYAKGSLSDGLLLTIIEDCRSLGKKVLVDPKGKDYSKYRGATIITPNRLEAADACNLAENTLEMVDLAGATLLNELVLEAVLITQGELGMTLFRPNTPSRHFPTSARAVFDVTGAGDTVIATLGTAMGSGADLATSTHLANIAAGLVVEQIGTSSISLSDLRRELGADREGIVNA